VRPTPGFLRGFDSQTILRNLTSLGLSAIRRGFYLQYFYHCPALRELKINNCKFDSQDTLPASDTPRPQLHSLHLRADGLAQMRILEWMLTPEGAFDLTALTTFITLDYTDEPEAYTWIQEVVKLCAPTLRDLMINPPTRLAGLSPVITPDYLLHPSTLSNLRFFTISIIQDSVDYSNFIPWMKAFFSQFPSENRLEEIRIPCMFMGPEAAPGDLGPPIMAYNMESYDWNALDTALDSHRLNKLQRVVFGIYDIYDQANGSETLGPLLRGLLPRLNARGILEIVKSETHGYLAKEERWWHIG
ncbi:hypothetical protein BDN72DRAFT_839411, partial [Pluteus cervinus]